MYINLFNFQVTLKPRTGNHSEGCGIVWNFNKFTLENVYSLEFNAFSGMPKEVIDDKNIYSRDNIAVFAVLKLKENPKKIIIVCCSHILFNNNRGDIKLGQVTQILNTFKELEDMYCKYFFFILT